MNAGQKHALWRGNWQRDNAWTMPAYSRDASNGEAQVVLQTPNKAEWRLLAWGNEVFRHKSLFQVLQEANSRGLERNEHHC